MKKFIHQTKGFTLIEMLMYMGLFLILVGILLNIFLSILDTQLSSDTNSSVDQNGRYILARLIYDIQRAQAITTPSIPGQSTNTLQITANSINYSYALDTNGNLQITDTTNHIGPDNLNQYDASISALTFSRLGNTGGENTIQIGLTITSRTKKRNGPEVKVFQTTIGTRCIINAGVCL